MEEKGDPCVCAAWAAFARHAVHEGWFGERSPQMAALFLRMTDEVGSVPAPVFTEMCHDFTSEFKGFARLYADQAAAVRQLGPARGQRPDFWYLAPETLYRRAAELDPVPETFMAWYAAARTAGVRARAAQAWHEALPADARPLLHLVELAEGRASLHKAIKLLDQAEAIDALNPQVRRARFRLWVARAIGHLGRRELRLAERDVAAIEALPIAREGDRPALVSALRAALRVAAGSREQADATRDEVARHLGGAVAADLLLDAVAGAGGRGDGHGHGRGHGHGAAPAEGAAAAPSQERGVLTRSVARVHLLAAEVRIEVHLPPDLSRR
jgi:hypothetical protein